MRTRQWIGLGLSCLTVVVLVLGMLDPGAAIAVVPGSGALILVTWTVSRVPVPVPLIVTWAASVALTGVTVLAAAFLALSSPTGIDDGFPWWLWGVVLCHAATAACSGWYAVRHARALRHPAALGNAEHA